MEFIEKKSNIFIRLLKKNKIFSADFIYRMYFIPIFGSKLFYKHKISSFRSCAFCQHLSYNKTTKKYICSFAIYEACSSLVPCIIPDTSNTGENLEESEQIPWLFRKPCLNFDVLSHKKYFRNFTASNFCTNIINLETLQGILMGTCAGNIPCHICACANKDIYTNCKNTKKAAESGKCSIIYGNINSCFSASTVLSKVS